MNAATIKVIKVFYATYQNVRSNIMLVETINFCFECFVVENTFIRKKLCEYCSKTSNFYLKRRIW